MMKNQRGFTLIELVIAIAVIAVIVTLAAPSFANFILVQRLKSINAQLVTDLQLARSDAAVRSLPVRVRFGSVANSFTCYTLYTGPAESCDCAASPVCGAGSEVRTVRVDMSLKVALSTNRPEFAYDPSTGGVIFAADDFGGAVPDDFLITAFIDLPRTLRTTVALSGRPSVCAPRTSMGVAPC